MYVNYEADRSCNDITQYPVFPHLIADYKSASLDLKNPHTFRDLCNPIGALNPSRLEHFIQRFNSMPVPTCQADIDDGISPPFM